MSAPAPRPHPTKAYDDGDDVDDMIARNPCAKFYAALEQCLLDTDRDFKKCQPQIKDLAACAKKTTQGGKKKA